METEQEIEGKQMKKALQGEETGKLGGRAQAQGRHLMGRTWSI
jgi:hypothetical protein